MCNQYYIFPEKLLGRRIFLVGCESLFRRILWAWRQKTHIHRSIFGLNDQLLIDSLELLTVRLLLKFSPLSCTLWYKIPCVFHQTYSLTFSTNMFSFGVPCGTSSESNQCNPIWILSNALHFSYQVKIDSKKFAFLAMESIDWQVAILWILVTIHRLSVSLTEMISQSFKINI